MNQSIFQIKKRQELKIKTKKLYKQGLTTREVGSIVGKSHQWVADVVRELSTEGTIDKN